MDAVLLLKIGVSLLVIVAAAIVIACIFPDEEDERPDVDLVIDRERRNEAQRLQLRQRYHLAVLWLLTVCAKGVVDTIYQRGHEDGANELRAFMRRELLAIDAASTEARLRSYNHGFSDAMRYLSAQEPQDDAPPERVM